MISIVRSEGVEKGIKIGIDQGKKIGIDQGKIEVIKEMLNENLPIDLIIKVTKLKKIEIEKLINN